MYQCAMHEHVKDPSALPECRVRRTTSGNTAAHTRHCIKHAYTHTHYAGLVTKLGADVT